MIKRISQMAGDEPTDADIEAAKSHAADAIAFVDDIESAAESEHTYDEYSVVARLGEHRIVGDIDRLLVIPDRYYIINYKTNDVSGTTTEELAAHYRPQLLSYALALFQHDSSRRVRMTLRFTDVGVTESFDWEATQTTEIESELRPLVRELDE